MKSLELYNILEKDFMLSDCKDNWSNIQFNQFVTNNFKARYMGLLADNTDCVEHVFTAVFPSKNATDFIVKSGITNALLFTHHPMNCDISKIPIFYDIGEQEYKMLKERYISIYTLHTPLDNNGAYSTAISLGKALEIEYISDLFLYFGHYAGLIGKTECKTIDDLQKKLESVLGHHTVLYKNGTDIINNGFVGLVAGGGNVATIYEELYKKGINTYITGIGNMKTGYPPAIKAHETAQSNDINILTGTHYSTEKFACIKMIDYFNDIGLSAEFINDIPDFNDM